MKGKGRCTQGVRGEWDSGDPTPSRLDERIRCYVMVATLP